MFWTKVNKLFHVDERHKKQADKQIDDLFVPAVNVKNIMNLELTVITQKKSLEKPNFPCTSN